MDNIFRKWKEGLSKTSKSTFSQIYQLLVTSRFDQSTYDELETILIQSDVGNQTTQEILNDLREHQKGEKITTTTHLLEVFREILLEKIISPPPITFSSKPAVILMVGVNGSGKTTSIAKISSHFVRNGKKVVLAAADTYRAAAVDQLQIWAKRLNLPIVIGQPGGDSGAVAYDAIKSALAHHADIVLIDTAGRLHTRYNLMEELKKVYRVCEKAMTGAPHAVWLVIDATTGQNAIQQASAFKEAVNVNGIILAKLDSSARGGMVFAIQKELDLPILFAGLGEDLEDLEIFNPSAFVEGILGNNN